MALSSIAFVGFAIALAAVYFRVPPKARWAVIVFASLYFYSSWETGGAVFGLLILSLLVYLCGIGLHEYPSHRKWILSFGLLISLGTLVMLKYFNFFVAEAQRLLVGWHATAEGAPLPEIPWALPVGFSFITFTAASYLIDVYRGDLPPEKHFGKLVAYISFFPKVLAGPIDRATNFLPQLKEKVRFDAARAGEGMQLILWGFFKKVVIADRLAPFVAAGFDSPLYATPPQLMVAVYFYAFQIYCDFSGYTDIAVGASKMFGIDLAPNFRRPYLARSVSEFWSRRWHVSLGSWFRDYLYIPLGGNRVPAVLVYRNLMAVFVVSGLWHAGMVGAAVSWSFVAWGAMNGLYVCLSAALAPLRRRLAERFPRLNGMPGAATLQTVVTFHLIMFSWIFFRAASVADARMIIGKLLDQIGRIGFLFRFYDYANFEFLLSLGLIGLLLIVELWDEREPMWRRISVQPLYWRLGVYYALLLALLVFGKWGTTEFIYMQF